MFGYVKIAEDELKVKEFKRYKNYYCGLCRQTACYSQVSRLMLSYDMVFLALLIESEPPQDVRFCKAKLFRRCGKVCGDLKMKYVSAISIILLYYKLQNDVYDGERFKKFFMRLISGGYKVAAADFPEIDQKIAGSMQMLYELERNSCSQYDVLERCFSSPFSDMFMLAPIQDEFLSIKSEIAYHVAAWVYLFDMLQDMEADRKNNAFNAILLQPDEGVGKAEVMEMLEGHVAKASELLELLPYSQNIPILKNIVLLGLPLQVENGKQKCAAH